MTDTFTWPVIATATGDGTFVTARAQFGDLYSQEAAIGLTNEKQSWSVTIVDRDVLAALAFVRSKKGAESFFWKPPLGVIGYYRCKKYSPANQGGGLWTLTCEFEQVGSP